MAGPGEGIVDTVRGVGVDDRGMVTVEAAYGIAAIVVAVVLAVGAVSGVIAQIRCTDAAREIARLQAAGHDDAEAIGRQLVGSGSRITVRESDDRITVEVSARVLLLPGLRVSAQAVAVPEDRLSEDVVQFAPGVAS